jgi:hypothetical protein
MAYTMAQLSAYCLAHGWTDQTATGVVALYEWINDMIQLLASHRNWPFYRRTGYLTLVAPYTAGTVEVTAGDAEVAGTTTSWTDAMIGQELYVDGDAARVYTIADVADGTTLTLTQDYPGASGAGKTYSIRYVRYALSADYDHYGSFYVEQDGRELAADMSIDEWEQARLEGRDTNSWPVALAVHDGAAYVHPAPATAKAVRYTYWASPAEGTDSVGPDWPEKYRYILHALLRIEVATKSRDGTSAFETQWFEELIEKALARSDEERGPISITLGRRRGKMSWQQAQSQIQIL